VEHEYLWAKGGVADQATTNQKNEFKTSNIVYCLSVVESMTHFIQIFVDQNGKCPRDIRNIPESGLKLIPIENMLELSTIKVLYDSRRVSAWMAVNSIAIKSFMAGMPYNIICSGGNVEITVDFTLGYGIKIGTIKITSPGENHFTYLVFPTEFKFPSGYDITYSNDGGVHMNTYTNSTHRRGSLVSTNLVVWLGPNQSLPKSNEHSLHEYRFPIHIKDFKLISPIRIIDLDNSSRKCKYPTPTTAYTKITKSAIESHRKGVIIHFASIENDYEFIVDFSAKQRTGFIHISDHINLVTYEIKAQFPINYIL